jgi:hypothetical protein
MKNTQYRRKPNSIFDEQVKAINSFGIGSTYTVKEMRKRMKVGSQNTERVGDYHLDLLSTKCIERVKHGTYRVLGFIPDFLTLNMCEANRGYTTLAPNPKYIGKSEFWSSDAPLSKWYINGERPRIEVQRGKKWMLGDPNPFESPIETKKKEFQHKYSELCLATNTHFDIRATTDSGMEFIVNRVNGEYAYGDCNRVPIRIWICDISILELVPSKKSVKRDQIIAILKQGLSASDAADQIIKL